MSVFKHTATDLETKQKRNSQPISLYSLTLTHSHSYVPARARAGPPAPSPSDPLRLEFSSTPNKKKIGMYSHIKAPKPNLPNLNSFRPVYCISQPQPQPATATRNRSAPPFPSLHSLFWFWLMWWWLLVLLWSGLVWSALLWSVQ